jgi:hypothetical protein
MEHIELDSNRISSLPAILYTATSLKYLSLKGNPLPPEEQARIRRQLPWVEIVF